MSEQPPGHAEAAGQGIPPSEPPVAARSQTMQPTIHPKVAAGALAGAVMIVAAWAVSYFGHVMQPAEVVAAETVIVQSAVAWLVPSSAT